MHLVAVIISTCSICASVLDQVYNTEPEGDFYQAWRTNWQQSTTTGQGYYNRIQLKACNSFSCSGICVKVHANGAHWRIARAVN